jgi:hypothetical protein
MIISGRLHGHRSRPPDDMGASMEPEDLFAGHLVALGVLARVRVVLEVGGPVEVRATKSQVAFRRTRSFAWLWRPGQYLGGAVAPAVLSIALGRRDGSSRWKEVVQPSSGHWMHHLEVRDPSEIDHEVEAWLREAADRAG